MRRGEEGIALVLVLVTMMILLPLALILSSIVVSWQRQATEFRDLQAEELAALAGFEMALGHLRLGAVSAGFGESSHFQVRDLGALAADVRVSRQPDAILDWEGRVLDASGSASIDFGQTGTDAEGRVVHRYRRVGVYLVEVTVSARASLAGVRLRGILLRKPDGSVASVGAGLERGFF